MEATLKERDGRRKDMKGLKSEVRSQRSWIIELKLEVGESYFGLQ